MGWKEVLNGEGLYKKEAASLHISGDNWTAQSPLTWNSTLKLLTVSLNVDGGSAASVYLVAQNIDGGNA